jgi:Skp family chaperone for outer membrane proteins
MKILKYRVIQLFVFMLLIQPFQMLADGKFEVRVAVVEIQLILEQSKAVETIRHKIDAINETIQKEVSLKEAEFKKDEEQLLKKRSTVTPVVFDQEVQKFEKLVSEAQRELQQKKSKLEHAHAEAIGKVHEVTIEIINELARKYKVNLVLPSAQVLFAAKELHITNEVIKLLNERITNVKVTY